MADILVAEKLNLGIKIAALGLGEVDYLTDTIILDDRAASFFELSAHEPISRDSLHERIHPEDRGGVEDQVNCLLSPESEGFITVIHRVINSDHSVRWLSARKQIKFEGKLPNGNPKPKSGLVAIQDITQFKEAEARIQYLMGEVAHRSKNLLAVVQGLARLTARYSSPDDFMTQFSARLAALNTNQSVLVENEWTRIDIMRLSKSTLEPYLSGSQGRVTFEGPQITLREKAAQSIGMALHELATNAVKYGALSNLTGEISISWKVLKGETSDFVIEWVESGGPAVEKPSRKGFGETVIKQIAASSVSGQIDLNYAPSGVTWTLSAPLKNIAV